MPPFLNNLKHTLSQVQSFPDEWEEHSVFFVPAVKKRTDMPMAAENRTR
jgi:hypothetical protein